MARDVSHEKVQQTTYDVVIVGSGYAGANMAYLLGQAGKRVLIIEAGPGIEHSREDYLENFFLNTFKSPSSPYPPNDNGLDPAQTNAPRATIQALVEGWDDTSKSYLTYDTAKNSWAFASTNERLAGGTGNHWMGTCLRMEQADFELNTTTGGIGLNWPITYSELEPYYGQAEHIIGVSADKTEQELINGTIYEPGYEYPMRRIEPSYWDRTFKDKVDGHALTADNSTPALVSSTPAGRNSEPYMNRRVCHGNTNCTPMCPIQAKYDPQFTLSLAMDTGNVDMISKSVVDVLLWEKKDNVYSITGVHYITYDDISVPAKSGPTGAYTAKGTIFVLAAHAVENAKILLNTKKQTGVDIANSSGLVGKNFMDHPTYLAWGLMPENAPVYCYRGPLSTSGVENLRNASFRAHRASWRIELGNAAWNWPIGDPYVTGLDFLYSTNNSQLNPSRVILGNTDYVSTVNDLLARQFRIAFLVEQDAETSNSVSLHPTLTDNLGIPRPLVNYQLSEYTMKGFQSAREATNKIMTLLGATQYTLTTPDNGTYFVYPQGSTDPSAKYNYQGAGHMCGTHVMGSDSKTSVVNSYQLTWDNPNLYLAGCGSMPSVGTENPTLTMLALACRTVDDIVAKLG